MRFKQHRKITAAVSVALTLIMMVASILIGAHIIPADSALAKEIKTEATLKAHPDNGLLTAIDSSKTTAIKLIIDTASINIITTEKDTFRLSYTGGADKSYHASVKMTGAEKETAEITITGRTQQINSMDKLTELDTVTLEIPDRAYQRIDIEEKHSVLNICEINAVVNARDTDGIISLKQSRLKKGSYTLSTNQGIINIDITELLTRMTLDNADGIVNVNFDDEPEVGMLLLGITGDQDNVTIPKGWDSYRTNKDLSKQDRLSNNKASLSINNHSGFTTVVVADNLNNTPITMKTATIANEKYYLIENEDELRAIGSEAYPLSGNYMLNKDITLTKEWKAIGNDEAPFTGKFEGNGLTISNLTTTDKKAKYIGLFGYAKGATIHNVILSRVNIDSAGGKGRSIGPIVAIALDCEVTDNEVK